MVDVYMEGYYEGESGEYSSANPYEPETKEWEDWLSGWQDGNDCYETRQEEESDS